MKWNNPKYQGSNINKCYQYISRGIPLSRWNKAKQDPVYINYYNVLNDFL